MLAQMPRLVIQKVRVRGEGCEFAEFEREEERERDRGKHAQKEREIEIVSENQESEE